MNADNIAVMDKGLLVEQGTHDNLMEAGGVYSSLVARQVPNYLPALIFPVFFFFVKHVSGIRQACEYLHSSSFLFGFFSL